MNVNIPGHILRVVEIDETTSSDLPERHGGGDRQENINHLNLILRHKGLHRLPAIIGNIPNKFQDLIVENLIPGQAADEKGRLRS